MKNNGKLNLMSVTETVVKLQVTYSVTGYFRSDGKEQLESVVNTDTEMYTEE